MAEIKTGKFNHLTSLKKTGNLPEEDEPGLSFFERVRRKIAKKHDINALLGIKRDEHPRD